MAVISRGWLMLLTCGVREGQMSYMPRPGTWRYQPLSAPCEGTGGERRQPAGSHISHCLYPLDSSPTAHEWLPHLPQ